MSTRHLVLVFLFSGLVLANSQKTIGNNFELPAIFSDHMVLQQKAEVPFWGKATPQLKISLQASWGASAQATVQNDSLWQAKLKTPKAGGPYEIKIQIGDSTIVYKDVLIGEVWLCSGQSNMEMPLEGWPPRDTVAGAAQTIQQAANPDLRLFTVQRAYSNKP
ncbi:MAG: glycosyl hydrolase family 2, partial [candidate division KSB1 bacterium]|nr:glycosyl hydrolase family 2 [candidate division KSB1 bacterium]